jgi:hypothetical protein
MLASCSTLARVAAISFALALVPAVALAQRGWREASLVSAIVQSVDDTKVAVDAAGVATAVWVEGVPVSFTVKASRMPPGGTWSAPVALSNPLPGANAAVAADSAGGALAVWTTDSGIFAAQYSADTGTWSTATTIAARNGARAPDVASDEQGNAIVTWHTEAARPYRVETVRYAAAAGTWGAVVDLGAGWAAQVGVDAEGNAIALWADPSALPSPVVTARYTAAGAQWGEPEILGRADLFVPTTDLAVDPSGNAMATWTALDASAMWRVQVATFWMPAATWSSPITLWTAPYVLSMLTPSVVFARDDALVAWTTATDGVLFSRYDLLNGSGGWSAPAPVARPGHATAIDLAADGLGSAFVVAQASNGVVYGGRYSREAQRWEYLAALSPAGVNALQPQVAAAPTGTATVVFRGSAGSVAAVLDAQWDGTLAPPLLTSVTASAGTLSLAVTGPGGVTLPDFQPLNYEYSVDDGVTWVARSPASTASPIVIDGLADFTPYQVRLRTANVAGSGTPSPAAVAIAGSGPATPSGFVATNIDGNVVTFKWIPPAVGAVPTSYVVEGGMTPGETLRAVDTGSDAPAFTVDVPSGVFYVRVRAVSFASAGAPSNEIRIVVNVPEPPSAPINLLGLTDGDAIALSWTNTFQGGAPTGLSLVVTGALDTVLPLGLTETFQFAGVPPGTYTLQVVATNARGTSTPSNAVTLTFPGACSGGPGVPTHVVAQRVEHTIVVSWEPPANGGAVTHYWVIVGGGLVGAFPTTDRSVSGAVDPGSYAIRVAAANACGVGAGSVPQTIVVP